MKEIVRSLVAEALQRAKAGGELQLIAFPDIVIEEPKDEKMGDFSTTVAMLLAKAEKRNPKVIAEIICRHLGNGGGEVISAEPAGPGYINFQMTGGFFLRHLKEAIALGENFGRGKADKTLKIILEFVSANPTGPLHVGHGRGAAVGDSLAKLLKFAGYDVATEYYINDVGNQMNSLGRSTWIRYQQMHGVPVEFPEGLYRGDYINDVAKEVTDKHGKEFIGKSDEEALPFFRRFSKDSVLNGIKKDLDNFRVTYDCWFSEESLYEDGSVDRGIAWLREKDFIYDKDGAVWLRSSAARDEKDRVIIKQTGEKTYFCSDIAYHRNKVDRGFTKIIDIWGADHHGYVPRMQAVLEAMGYGDDKFKVLLVQFVTLKRGGEKASMSTRSGEFITLEEVVAEVGIDAARFFFMMRSLDTHLDFDMELAKKETPENPVYYIQYAHARICSVFRTAREQGVEPPDAAKTDLSPLREPEEIALIKKILAFPEVVEKSALVFEGHRIPFYLQDLAAAFHGYYNKHRVVTEDKALTLARLTLLECVRRILKNGLTIIGVSAPQKM